MTDEEIYQNKRRRINKRVNHRYRTNDEFANKMRKNSLRQYYKKRRRFWPTTIGVGNCFLKNGQVPTQEDEEKLGEYMLFTEPIFTHHNMKIYLIRHIYSNVAYYINYVPEKAKLVQATSDYEKSESYKAMLRLFYEK